MKELPNKSTFLSGVIDFYRVVTTVIKNKINKTQNYTTVIVFKI